MDEYLGLDIDSEIARGRNVADYFYSGGVFPFPDNSFNSILCNQVLEHVFNPDEFLSEIVRVLAPGGRILLTAPFVWDEHEQPYDFARYSTFGLRALLERQGLEIHHHKKIGADASILFQLANAYLFKVTQRWPFPVRLLYFFAVACINVTGVLARYLLPANGDLFLDHAILARKPA